MNKKNITLCYVCLDCQKVFKKYKYTQDAAGNWQGINYDVICPQCAVVMFEAGTAFKAPKKTDSKAWLKLKPIFERGCKFNPDFGSPFDKALPVKVVHPREPKSEFRKPARKRLCDH